MTRVRILRHGPSKGARRLRDALVQRGVDCKLLQLNTHFRPTPEDVVINWGCNSPPLSFDETNYPTWINGPGPVSNATDKLVLYNTAVLNGMSNLIPDYTTAPDVAHGWVEYENHPGHSSEVAGFARQLTRASGGRGIVPFYHATEYSIEGEVFPTAPLYVKYMKKRDEYRIHIVNGDVIDEQQKRKRRGDAETDYHIRTHDNNWVFCRDNVETPPCVIDAALRIMSVTGLDFGAVDVGFNAHYNSATVYEINTAPGIEGTTVENYVEALYTGGII